VQVIFKVPGLTCTGYPRTLFLAMSLFTRATRGSPTTMPNSPGSLVPRASLVSANASRRVHLPTMISRSAQPVGTLPKGIFAPMLHGKFAEPGVKGTRGSGGGLDRISATVWHLELVFPFPFWACAAAASAVRMSWYFMANSRVSVFDPRADVGDVQINISSG
jgi:hypothetical protein